jgi:hypothetical protein
MAKLDGIGKVQLLSADKSALGTLGVTLKLGLGLAFTRMLV